MIQQANREQCRIAMIQAVVRVEAVNWGITQTKYKLGKYLNLRLRCTSKSSWGDLASAFDHPSMPLRTSGNIFRSRFDQDYLAGGFVLLCMF